MKSSMWKTILDLIFPINCLGCGQPGQFICFSCFKQMPLNQKPGLKSNSQSNLNNLIIASYYEHPLIKEAIHQYKYNFIKDLAEPLAKLMIKKLDVIASEAKQSRGKTILIPIPLHPKRLRWRGFNQSLLLAEKISQALNLPMIDNLLIRTKHTLPQVKLQNSLARQQNIRQAFALNSNRSNLESNLDFSNKTLILIDDISTTGATLEEAAQTLKPLNPKQIWGLVIAQG
ncbi:MAG: ComF family protein [Patescibacteria group bacterium]